MNKYIAITPFKDEEKYLPMLILSFEQLLHKPIVWYLVDDGSEDGSRLLADKFSRQAPWVKIISMPKRRKRIRGKAVVNAIMQAYEDSKGIEYEYMVKIDADISFDGDLFDLLISKMITNPKLGICGPELIIERAEGWEIDRALPKDFVRGAVRIYRHECLIAINGLIPKKGWDGIDQIKAKVAGWSVERFSDIIAKNHREQGDATGVIKAAIENGRGSYYIGLPYTSVLYESVQYAKIRPYLVKGVFMIIGYLIGFLLQDRISDKAVVKYLRSKKIEK